MAGSTTKTTVTGGHIEGIVGASTVVIHNLIYNRAVEEPAATDTAGEPIAPCPYPGLAYFGPQEAGLFFGRDAVITRLTEAVSRQSLTALVGASGSGKSSVVLAGLAPRLGSASGWLFSHFRIGTELDKDPFLALARALVPLYVASDTDTERLRNTKQLAAELRTGELTLHDVFADCRSRNKGTRVLLIADQFEEAYTSVEDEVLRHRFIDALLAGFSDSAPRGSPKICLILTLRGDFYGRALRHRPLADALQDHVENLGPMDRKELEAAIRRPAEILKVSFEPGLVETLLDDVENKPGSLPLLQFALREMWGRQEKRKITRQSYDAIGGVEGALAQRAETIFAAMTGNGANPQIIQAFRRLFTRLVTLGEGQEDTRRVVDRRELGDDAWSLAQRLAGEDNRLVVTNAPAFSRETAEVSHEALLRNWPKLVSWIKDDRTFQIWLRQIRSNVELWSVDPSDDGPLLRGGMLAQARDWLAERRDDFSAAELGYIDASIALQQRVNEEREAGRQAEIRRQQELAEAANKLAEARQAEARHQQELAEAAVKLAAEQRRRARIATVGGIVAFVLAVVAIIGGYEFYVERDIARVHLTAAEARLLINKSDFLLKNEPGEIDLAALLAAQAVSMNPSIDAAQSLGNALDLLPRRLVFQADGFNQKSVAFSPDGQYVAFVSPDGATQLGSLKTGQIIQSLREGSPRRLVHSTLVITSGLTGDKSAFLEVGPKEEGESSERVQATTTGERIGSRSLRRIIFPLPSIRPRNCWPRLRATPPSASGR